MQLSSFRQSFSHAAHHTARTLVHRAGFLAGAFNIASDMVMSASAYLQSGSFHFDPLHMDAPQWMSLAGIGFVVSSLAMIAGDKWPKAKILSGATAIAAGAAMAMAVQENSTWELYGATISGIFSAPSMVFENMMNAWSDKLSGKDGVFARAGRAITKYPVALSSAAQLVGVSFIMAAGIHYPQSAAFYFSYGALWGASALAKMLTDNNLRVDALEKITAGLEGLKATTVRAAHVPGKIAHAAVTTAKGKASSVFSVLSVCRSNNPNGPAKCPAPGMGMGDVM